MTSKLDTGLDAKRISANIFFNIVAFVLNMAISFFITPHITETIGEEAYGFVKLSNEFVNYATLASIALNSMASRFIMLERERNNFEKAREYYSSITVANTILTGALVVVSVVLVTFMDKFLVIPQNLVASVKLTFAITFFGFLIKLLFSTKSNCYFLSNRLDVYSKVESVANILRVCTIIGLFVVLSPNIAFMAIGGLVFSVFTVVCNYFNHKKFTPELHFEKAKVKWKTVKEVLSSGVWNSITKLSQIFSSGLDLLVTNLALGPQNMGYLSIAKTVPQILATFNSTIANAFSPNMMLLYAKGDMEKLKSASKTAMKFMCIFVTIPTAVLITMGTEFFSLWVPEQPAKLINVLSILTIVNSCITGPMQPLYQIFTITNKIKQSSIVMIIYGFASILVTLVCLNLTDLGLYAVAGVSLVGSIIVALCYHLPFSAKYIGLPWHTFFPEIFKSVLSLAVQCVLGLAINQFFSLGKSWVMWFGGAILSAIISVIINIFLILNAQERSALVGMAKGKIFGKRK